ncbi:MAG: hypothetical protein IKI20_06205 [Lachnospiraceae bacterium]|nr:hypothetical protein [Lachnospiraceae bacterium]
MKRYGIVMTGYAGCFGAGLVAEKKSKALLERFPSFLVRNAILQGKEDENEKAMSLLKESDDDYGMIGMEVVSDGGVFKGLWNLGETCDVGFSVDLKEIPIRQETVEVCNFFDINPYQLYSQGVMLFLAEDARGLCEAFRKNHIPAAIIGRTHAEKKRVIVNEDEERFLEPRKQDSLLELKEGKE